MGVMESYKEEGGIDDEGVRENECLLTGVLFWVLDMEVVELG